MVKVAWNETEFRVNMQTILFQGQTVPGIHPAQGQLAPVEDSAPTDADFGALFAGITPSGIAIATGVRDEISDGFSSEQPITGASPDLASPIQPGNPDQSENLGQLEMSDQLEMPGQLEIHDELVTPDVPAISVPLDTPNLPETFAGAETWRRMAEIYNPVNTISNLPGGPTQKPDNAQEIDSEVFIEKNLAWNLAGRVDERVDLPHQPITADGTRHGLDKSQDPRIEVSVAEVTDDAADRKSQLLSRPQYGERVEPRAIASILFAKSDVPAAMHHNRAPVATEAPKLAADVRENIVTLGDVLAQTLRVAPEKAGNSRVEPSPRATIRHPMQFAQGSSETPKNLAGRQVSDPAPTSAVLVASAPVSDTLRAVAPHVSVDIHTGPVRDVPDIVQTAPEAGATQVPTAPTDLAASIDLERSGTLAEFDPITSPTTLRSDVARNIEPYAPFDSALARPETARHVAAQMAAALHTLPGKATEIALNPEELGRVRMVLSTSETGVSVSITTERPETMDLMRRHIDQLAAEFRRLGYDDVGFDFSGGTTGGFGHEDANSQPVATPDVDSPEPKIENTNRAMAPGGLDLRL